MNRNEKICTHCASTLTTAAAVAIIANDKIEKMSHLTPVRTKLKCMRAAVVRF